MCMRLGKRVPYVAAAWLRGQGNRCERDEDCCSSPERSALSSHPRYSFSFLCNPAQPSQSVLSPWRQILHGVLCSGQFPLTCIIIAKMTKCFGSQPICLPAAPYSTQKLAGLQILPLGRTGLVGGNEREEFELTSSC